MGRYTRVHITIYKWSDTSLAYRTNNIDLDKIDIAQSINKSNV